MAVLGPGGEDTGVAMWQFWVRIRGCYVAVLGPGGEDTGEDTGVAMLAPWRWEVFGQRASCLLIPCFPGVIFAILQIADATNTDGFTWRYL